MERLQEWVAKATKVMLVLFAVAVIVIMGAAGPASAQGGIRFGIWYAYNDGVPPLTSFAARGIDASVITGKY